MKKLIDPELALRLVLEAAPPPRPAALPVAAALGLTLAETVAADRDYPPFDRAMMDGYAVISADAGRTVEVMGEVAAGQSPGGIEVSPGRCVAIMTGAACPPGTGAVVMKEQTRREGDAVALPATITPGKHIAPRGCERVAGAPVLEAGVRLTPLGVAALASVGRTEVQVFAPPRLCIVTTGSELVDVDERPGPVQIRDSNGPMLAAQAARLGLSAPQILRALDTPRSLADALDACREAEVVLLSGGVSMGNYDLVPAALADHGAELIFHKVTQKPGKPLVLARREGRLLLGLPGNPLSSHLCWHRYVVPAVRAILGRPAQPRERRGLLAAALSSSSDRTQFLLARAERIDGAWRLHPRLGLGSADIFAGVDADAYLRLPPGEHRLAAGQAVTFEWIGQRS